MDGLTVWLLSGHVFGFWVTLFIGVEEAADRPRSTMGSRRAGARMVLLSPVWEVWILYGLWLALREFGRWIGRMWRLADWI